MNIVIIENDSYELENLEKELYKWGNDNSVAITISSYSSGEEYFLNHISQGTDLFILDIQLNGMNGMEIAEKLRKESYDGFIVFLTSHQEFVLKGYSVHAFYYLLKPLDKQMLSRCLREVAATLDKKYYICKYKQEQVMIEYQKILLFSSNLHHIEIVTEDGNYDQYTTMNNIIGNLPKEFIRIHRSYIVNLAHICKITNNIITLSNGYEIPVGRAYLNNLRVAFSKYSSKMDN